MANVDDTVLEPVLIKTGAVYERPRGDEMEQMLCLARITQCGKVLGLFRRFGLTFERLDESSEEMMSWKLVFAPDGSHLPKKETKKLTKKAHRTNKTAEAK